ncbi:MAG: hypothetical protein H0V51_08635 [Chloroflexi bacterium]|nr:hypothetical protein [Chloroflexota bacterium]
MLAGDDQQETRKLRPALLVVRLPGPLLQPRQRLRPPLAVLVRSAPDGSPSAVIVVDYYALRCGGLSRVATLG